MPKLNSTGSEPVWPHVNEALVFGLLFLAVASGWLLGRRSKAEAASTTTLPSQYYRGLNYLLDGRPDGAVDHFIGALEVNSETLETHVALGNVLRRRGEVDRAIRLHENLLARPDLPLHQTHIAHRELARDYISAGLLDRAEKLLLDLVTESEEQRDIARHHLLEIYRSEREWRLAIEQARALLPRKSLLRSPSPDTHVSGQSVATQLAHCYCELALELAELGSRDEARQMLQLALRSDADCVRASLELGRLEASAGHHQRAIEALTHVVERHPDFIPQLIDTLRQSYQALGKEHALSRYLRDCLDKHPSTALVIAVSDDVLRDEGHAAARRFLATRLEQVPSLRGLRRLISLQQDPEALPSRPDIAPSDEDALAALPMLSVLLDRLIKERPVYRCEHCGFSARHLLWFCPGCKYWGTFRTIRTTAAE